MQRIAYHIQVFALSKWLAVTLPVEYYEFARGLQWSIPYLELPWERGTVPPMMVGSSSSKSRLVHSSEIRDTGVFKGVQPSVGSLDSAAKVYGLPLTPMEYRSYFEVICLAFTWFLSCNTGITAFAFSCIHFSHSKLDLSWYEPTHETCQFDLQAF